MSSLALVDSWQAPLAAVGVIDGAGTLARRGDTARRSRWASITKPVAALATLIAVEEGTVDLDQPAGPPGATIRHLLAHASGLAFDRDRILAEPGRRRIYSNTGYHVLATEISAAAGMPFERYLDEAVLQPLGMSATTLTGSAAAGLVGPLDDLLRFGAELLAPTLVSSATFAMATSVAFPGLAGVLPGFGHHDPMDWGLGFERRDHKSPHWTGSRNSPATFGHFGGSGSFLWVDPDIGLACAALSGREFDHWATRAWPELSDAVVAEYGARLAP
jgi:CubicO group peptidase (beta-lactamase class C family)